jgi:hypothetical protein
VALAGPVMRYFNITSELGVYRQKGPKGQAPITKKARYMDMSNYFPTIKDEPVTPDTLNKPLDMVVEPDGEA